MARFRWWRWGATAVVASMGNLQEASLMTDRANASRIHHWARPSPSGMIVGPVGLHSKEGRKKPLQQFHSEGGVRICERHKGHWRRRGMRCCMLKIKHIAIVCTEHWRRNPCHRINPAANSNTPHPKPTVIVLSLPTHPPLWSIKFNFSLLSSRVKKKNFKEVT